MPNPRKKSFYKSFKSGLEGLASDFLRTREAKFGYRSSYERLRLGYTIEGTYRPDFDLVFRDENGEIIHTRIIETKGYLDNEARRKMVAVRKANPDLDICFLFARDHALRKGAKLTYTKWATKVGYPSAVRDIPISWLTSKENLEVRNYSAKEITIE